jgi:hypothetical protein
LEPDQVAASDNLGPAYVLGTTSPVPPLGASVSSGSIVISWPVSGATGSFKLYSSPVLGPDAVWAPVTATSTVVGDAYQVSIPTTGNTTEFYVLKN